MIGRYWPTFAVILGVALSFLWTAALAYGTVHALVFLLF